MTPVLILDGNLKSALCAVRSLGKRGVSVVCGAEQNTAMALHSRFATEAFVYASPKQNPEAFIREVTKKARAIFEKSGQKVVIFSFSDATSLLLSLHQHELEQYCILPMPTEESVAIAADKKRTYELASEHLIPIIRTYGVHEYESITFPAVVKNRHSIIWKEKGSVSGSASFVFNKDELEKTVTHIAQETGESPLVQEFVKGDEYGIEMVCDHGEPIAVFAHKRIRSLSPRGGAAVVKETAVESPEVSQMEQYARTLCKVLSWHGPVMVEFKVDARTGGVLLMEINGRFWGSLPLAVKAGIDFPTVVYGLAIGGAQKPQAFAHRHMRTRHFLGDCKWLWHVLFARDPLRPVLYPSRLKAIFDFKMEIFKSKGDVFAIGDPMPSLFEFADIIAKWRLKG